MRNTLFTIKNNGLALAIRVSHGASKISIGDIILDQNNKKILKIYITAQPENNKANEAIIKLLSKTWHLKQNQINIVFGLKQRNKIIHISGNSKELLKHLEKFA